ncbi:synaptonemal complex protein 3-like isoform X1 [Eucyclogobius newberryi]|uniref:synaptonemal complex protein 3-like isoform X1 n=1 Tax=Eucyclogobius newberryi TaxID=166745 RepID=UPI003B5AEBAF
MASSKRQMKKMKPSDKSERKTFKDVKNKVLRASEDDEPDARVEKLSKKRPSSDLDDDDAALPARAGFKSMLDQFSSDINKAVQAKRKRLETLTGNYAKGSQHRLEQLWSARQNQRQRLAQEYSQQVSAALQQWEVEARRSEEQEERLNNLFKQQLKALQQVRAAQSQKLKAVRELYEAFAKNVEEMQKSHDAFVQAATQELRKEMSTLQKKILMDTQQEMANVRKSLTSMLF